MVDLTHLNALNLRRSHEAQRAASAKTQAESDSRSAWVSQIEKEIAHERAFLGLPDDTATEAIGDDELLAQLGVEVVMGRPGDGMSFAVASTNDAPGSNAKGLLASLLRRS